MSFSIGPKSLFPEDELNSFEKKDFKQPSDFEYDHPGSNDILSNKPSEEPSFLAYQQIMSDLTQVRQFDQLIFELKQQGISFDNNYICQQKTLHIKNSQNQLQILSMKHTKHYQILIFEVSLGPFSHEMTIYNTFEDTIFNLKQTYSRQDFSISPFIHSENHYIVKSMKLFNNQKDKIYFNEKKIIAMLKECLIGKIFSALKIGPKIPQEFGFDVYLEKSSCFFIMELCQPILKQKFTTQNDGEVLKQNLKEMHMLSIVHRDIKPDNIMYSPSYQKYVFIDFGVSQSILQSPNQLIYTSFAGTYRFSSKQMRALFENQESGWVNLHLNDAHGLQLSLRQLQEGAQMKNSQKIVVKNNEVKIQNSQFTFFLTQVKTKHVLFMKRPIKQIQETILFFPDEIIISVMNFLYEIPLYEGIRQFYKIFLQEKIEEQAGFEDLKVVFFNQIFYEFCQGNRKLLSHQKEAIQDIRIFFEKVQSRYCQSDQYRNLSIKELEFVVFGSYSHEKGEQNNYVRYVINYLNLKRISHTVPMKKKLQACQQYIERNELKIQKIEDFDNLKFLLEFVFHHILLTMKIEDKKWYFDEYLRGLQNYFLIAENIDIQILIGITDLISAIQAEEAFSFLEKIQYTLSLLYAMHQIQSRCFKIKIYQLVLQITNLVQQKINSFAYQSKFSDSHQHEAELCEFYLNYVNEFQYEFIVMSNGCPENQSEEVSNKIPKTTHKSVLFSFLQYNAIRKIEQSGDICFQLKQREEMLLEEMVENNEFNPNLIKMIHTSYVNKEMGRLIKLFGIYDSSVQIQCMNMPFVRLMVLACCQKDLLENLKLNTNFDIVKIEKQILTMLELKKDEDLMIYQLTSVAYTYFTLKTKDEKSRIFGIRMNIVGTITKNTSKAIKAYERLDTQIIYRGSAMNLYLDLLLRDVQSQQRIDLKRSDQDDEYFISEMVKQLKQIQSFKKLVSLDRSIFTQADHVFMIEIDFYWTKITNGKSSSNQIMNYFYSKKSMFIQIFKRKTVYHKGEILDFCNNVFRLLNVQKAFQKFTEFVEQTYPIVTKSFIIDNYFIELCNPFFVALVRASKFKELMFEIYESSIYFSSHFSSSNFVAVIKTWKLIMTKVFQFGDVKLFYQNLKQSLKQIDSKKHFTFNAFLLYCIKAFNRVKILKMILRNLGEINLTTKNFVLSRFYKEWLKVNEVNYLKKRKKFLRKDVRYSSQFLKTLEDMKKQVDPVNNLEQFLGILREKMEDRIIRLGKCCEVYSPKKATDPSNELVGHDILDGESWSQNVIWQSEEW